MKALFMAPVVFGLLLTVALQLHAIAEDVSQQSIDFAEDMRLAMPCATHGIPIEKCSPNLLSHDFEPEIERTLATLDEIKNQTQDMRHIIQSNDALSPSGFS